MKALAAAIATSVALAGCAGVIGITDVHVVDEPEAGASVTDGGTSAPDVQQTPADGATPNDTGTDAPIVSSSKRVFVSSTTTNAAIGSAAKADAICATAAAGLGGTWIAWFSTAESNVFERLNGKGPWARLDGKLVAADREQLKGGSLNNAISVTEKNQALAAEFVWTGTLADGTTSTTSTCQNWKDAVAPGYGEAGATDRKDGGWTQSNTFGGVFFVTCDKPAHLYCFEQ